MCLFPDGTKQIYCRLEGLAEKLTRVVLFDGRATSLREKTFPKT